MNYTVRGVQRRNGTYQGRPFDNVNVHCFSSTSENMLAGTPVEIVKFKASDFFDAFERYSDDADDVSLLLGKKLRVYFNKYGRAEDFDILGE